MAAKVYVGGLSDETNDTSLRDAFSKFGQILDAVVMIDRGTGKSRGFGFVTFASIQEAQDAISNMNDQELDGKIIRVNIASAKGSGGGGGGFSGVGAGDKFAKYGGDAGAYGRGYGTGAYGGDIGTGGYVGSDDFFNKTTE